MPFSTRQLDRAIVAERARQRALRGAGGVFGRHKPKWLESQIGEDFLDVAVITTGREAYRRSDGIAVIPAALPTS